MTSERGTIPRVKRSDLPPREYKPVWLNIIVILYLHIAAVYGLYLAAFRAKVYTTVLAVFLYWITILGITAGAHRLWAHRTYKAKLPLKLMLLFFQTLAHQGPVIWWCHNHRVHHKYSDTDADPHNVQRGLFYSHIGWLLCRLHPSAKQKKREMDMSDLKNDPLLAFQEKFYIFLTPILSFYAPTAVPVYMWGEGWNNAYHVNVLRYIVCLHITFLVNSFAHYLGNKPYDRYIRPGENALISVITEGEGWHNYHHAFPWDYKTSELGKYSTNTTTAFLDLMARIGWAYDLKAASPEIIKRRVQKIGDGTHEKWSCEKDELTLAFDGAAKASSAQYSSVLN